MSMNPSITALKSRHQAFSNHVHNRRVRFGHKAFGAAITAAALFASCSSSEKAVVRGSFCGVSNDTVILELLSATGSSQNDTTITDKKGNYRFHIRLNEQGPMFVNLHCDGSTIPLIVSRGERIKVNSICDLGRNYEVDGSNESRLLKEFNAFYNQSVKTLDSLAQLYYATSTQRDTDSSRVTLRKAFTKKYLEIKRKHIAFIVSNAKSMAAIYALYQRLPNDQWLYNDTDDLLYYRMVADSTSKLYPQSPRVKALQREVTERTQVLDLTNKINSMSTGETNYPDIILKNAEGKTQKLSELKGSLIIIDFWSTQDAASAVHNAELKKLWNLYHSKGLNIYQVSLDTEKAEWIYALQQQKLPWTSVYDPRGSAGAAAMSYNVHSVPSNILIFDNTVSDYNLSDQALEQKIANLLP